jgi:hypothetical protein
VIRALAALALLPALAATTAMASAPCEGVDRGLGKERADRLSQRLARELRDSNARATQEFLYDGWDIVGVTGAGSVEMYVFYPSDALSVGHVAIWRGGAGLDEVSQAKEWAVENAPGIPNQLARCFAVRVTAAR